MAQTRRSSCRAGSPNPAARRRHAGQERRLLPFLVLLLASVRSAGAYGRRSLWAKATCLLPLIATLALAFSTISLASPWPPVEGDWIIEEGEQVTWDQDYTFPANILVYGHLTFEKAQGSPGDLIVRFPHTRGLYSYGQVDASDTTFTTSDGQGGYGQVVYVQALGSSVNHFTNCMFDLAQTCFDGDSTNTISGCTFSRSFWWAYFQGDSDNTLTDCVFDGPDSITVEPAFQGRSTNHVTGCEIRCYGWAADTAASTFTDCTFYDFEFDVPSVNVLDHCTFTRNLNLLAFSGATVELAGLAPDQPMSASIPSGLSTDPFVTLADTTVARYCVSAHGDAHVTIDSCEMADVLCCDHSQTALLDSHTQYLYVWTSTHHTAGRGGVPCPDANSTVDIAVDNYHDSTGGVGPQTAAIISGNSPFRVDFVNSSVEITYLEFGDNGGARGSENHITQSTLYEAVVGDHSHLLVADGSTLRGGIFGWYIPDTSNAEFTAEDSSLLGLWVDGPHTTITVRRSTVGGPVLFHSWWDLYGEAAPYAPTLVLDSAHFGPGDTRVSAFHGAAGARVEGTAEVLPLWDVDEWAPGSTIIRSFPILVRDKFRQPISGATMRVQNEFGELVWQGVTSPIGSVEAEVTFDETNYASDFLVTAWNPDGGGVDSGPVGFLSSTPIVLSPGAHPLSTADFEQERYPWTEFGAGTATTWRHLGGSEIPRGGLTAPIAHSGGYEMLADVVGEGITGLRLALPVTPSWPMELDLRAWAQFVEPNPQDSSTFIGFTVEEGGPALPTPWDTALGYEILADGTGLLRLGRADLYEPAPALNRAAGWQCVKLSYNRSGHTLTLQVGDQTVGPYSVAPGVDAPAQAVMGVCGSGGSALETVCFDDADMTLGGTSPDTVPEHLYAAVSGRERVVQGTTVRHALAYGNGYPIVGGSPTPGEQGSDTMEVGLVLPEDLTLVASEPISPTRYVGDDPHQPVWSVTVPYLGQERYLLLEVEVPTGPSAPTGPIGSMMVWQDPPAGDPSAEDLLPQYVMTAENLRADLWARKKGPAVVCPGDTVNYQITVGNGGYVPAEWVTVKDLAPLEMGGGDRIVHGFAALAPDETWGGVLSLLLDPVTPSGAEVTNTAYVVSYSPELTYLNNSSDWTSLVQSIPDPNRVIMEQAGGAPRRGPSRSPGGVERGDLLRGTVECENEEAVSVQGVYAILTLDPRLDDNTLSLPAGMSYDPGSRTMLWEVGTLAPGAGASAFFEVEVSATARRARTIAMQAVVYFPSVPKQKETNVAVEVVNGSFSDVPWNHWAVLQVELTYENGIVRGYEDGAYQPAWLVDRGQMAVYIARALAGCDAEVTEGPAIPHFSDVGTSHWAYKYIEYAYSHGVVQGFDSGTYQPTWSVDRGQMAVYVARALAGGEGGVPPPPSIPTFSDVGPTGPSAWCYPHVEYVVDKGVVGGYADGTYRPQYTVTRDQMAVYVTRAFRLPM